MYPVEEHERAIVGDDFDSFDSLSTSQGILLGLFISLCIWGTVLALAVIVLPLVLA